MRWVLLPSDEARAAEMGGKARALAALRGAALPIPEWFVLSGDALIESLGGPFQAQPASANAPAEILAEIKHMQACRAVMDEVECALNQLLPDGGFVAVRSSASDEDGVEHSFAGQLESHLFVSRERVAEKIAAVWRSGFSERILTYRRQHDLSSVPHAPSVLVQRMVDADVSGVAFSADPVSGRRGMAVVSGVFGLGTALVSGEANADTWLVDRSGKILETRIADKMFAHRAAPGSAEGVRSEVVAADRARQPCLTDDQVRDVAALARRCAAHFGHPQDIEWAIADGQLFLLQSRPITSLADLADPDGQLNLWDNSNIAESYGGITTPLTYTFARRAYEEVYRQFCRLMAVPPARIAANTQVFRCMIGLVRGRVYYNLLNWYRVLALLPGFTVNRRFMEQMMGVKEGLPDELVRGIQHASAADQLKDIWHLCVTLAGLVRNHFTLPARIREFYERLNHALRPPTPPLDQMRPDELVAHYQDLERQLLTRWDAPLVNDFFAMIFYGTLRKLVSKWCGDTDGSLQNNLLCGEGGIISAEPARRVRELAGLAAQHPELVEQLVSAPLNEMRASIERVPEFAHGYREYLARFGDRCLDELKLESATLHDDPTLLLRSVGHLAKASRSSRREEAHAEIRNPKSEIRDEVSLLASTATANEGIEHQLRRDADSRVAAALKVRWLRSVIFRWVLKHTRARVRERENLRFERTRLFGRVRLIFVALGREFCARGLINEASDIFYLELNEVLGFCDGTTTTADLKGMVALRRAEFARYATMEPPADRFETRGPVHHGNLFQTMTKAGEVSSDGALKGIGCCPGVVRGPVRIVTNPKDVVLKPGEILVAERTDPGWIMLFAAASGLLVERGSLLSHSAIVSREMGLPCIVSIPGLLRHLTDGDSVEMDGAKGIVRKLNEQ
jgi:pyruvate,water dikinase